MKPAVPPGSDYTAFVADLKARVASARLSAARAVNRDLILLYWDLGRAIVEKQRTLGWGESVVEQVAADLRREFPGMTGFSARNLRDTKRFYLAYSDGPIWRQAVAELSPGGKRAAIWPRSVAKTDGDASRLEIWRQPVAKLTDDDLVSILRQLVAEIPWGQNLLLLNMLADPAARLYYLRATARFGWSRRVLLNQIKAGAWERSLKEGKAHNFPAALPEHLAEQAEEALKSSYNLEFLGIGRAVKERELEDRLIERLRDFILELGYGFCFIGRQHRLALGSKEYFVDLLFYHRFLKALVAIDLKVGEFEPEFAGKMDFYLNLLNDKERAPDDRPSIGIILCAEKDNLEVEYALKTKANPIGVAAYRLQPTLPANLKGKLPTARQLAAAIRPVLPAASRSNPPTP
jgi:predicted nuclease of restriction endonuclease-like (RecB) superfamily